MLKEKDLSSEILKDLIVKDTIGRNKHINTFISLLNTLSDNNILAIEGKWGTGKTIFVKQLIYLNRNKGCININNTIEKEKIEDFQNKYISFYYNAWENDYHSDPLQSILLNIINEMWNKKDQLNEKTKKVINTLGKSIFNNTVSVLSKGIIDLNKIDEIESIDDLVEEIKTTEKRKTAINSIINDYLQLEGKRLLFVIDELDRCNPSFAVKLLEIIKHYYDNDNIVFLIATNNLQLSYTIKKFYGSSFDSSGYLNKFYDLVFNLPEININKYLSYIGENHDGSYYKNTVPADVVKFLNFTMREIDRYYSTLKLLQNYFDRNTSYVNDKNKILFVKFIFIPLALGLKIIDLERYSSFKEGSNSEILSQFLEHSDIAKSIAGNTNIDSKSANQEALDFYNLMFKNDNRDSWHNPKETFLQTISLMSFL